ncbi:MAG: type VI secretion system ATPase TssH [Pikeienuella sp.]|uniref:type VI secretion system ATPase TssH n=1 Tax=Pikeienuella sp. TaxID=2831957 RepID=UPI00391DCFE7
MSEIGILFDRLDCAAREALNRAAEHCQARRLQFIEPEHLLVELLEDDEGPAARHLERCGVDAARARADLRAAVAAGPDGVSRDATISSGIVRALKEAWIVASAHVGAERIGPAELVKAMLADEALRGRILPLSPLLGLARAEAEAGPDDAEEEAPARRDDPLTLYARDLTADARAGAIDPVVGRDAEVRRLIDVLLRRRQNNPILTGEAGVGKTAVVEGLAQHIVAGRAPEALRRVRLLALDLGALQAGAGVRGEFAQRLKNVVDAVTASPRPIVLFIDEAHMLLGAGGQKGEGDAANLLKPALARGALRCVAATTWREYKRHIEKDPALARRFEVVRVSEPSTDTALEMLRGAVNRLEAHHGVRVLEEGLREAVRLSDRYISDRQLPDKAISVLDTACARVAMSQSEAPAALEGARAQLEAIAIEHARLEREGRILDDEDSRERRRALAAERSRLEESASVLEARWREERRLTRKLIELDAGEGPDDPALVEAANNLRLQLDTLREEGGPLVHAFVDAEAVGDVVSSLTGIPAGEMLRAGASGATDLLSRLRERIVSQDGALGVIARRAQTYFAQLGEPEKPTGVFLLAGPSGVGKTETATSLAEMLFGGRRALITVNMSEYQEAHSISGLKGAPPGYVGYGGGGVMTEAVRRRPYSVLLLDEIEKAHRDVIELFYQIFDKGVIEDSEGQLVDFRNTLIILTSNVGDMEIVEAAASGIVDPEALAARIRPALLRRFPAAFLGRLTVAPFLPLGPAELARVASMKLGRLGDRLAAVHRAELTYDRAVIDAIVARATDTESGARNIDAIISNNLAPTIAEAMLEGVVNEAPLREIHIGLDPGGDFALTKR